MIRQNLYKLSLIKALYGRDQMTIGDLSKEIEKSIPFTTNLVAELVSEGLLEEKGLASSSGGRKPQVFGFCKSCYYIAAVAVNQMRSSFVIYDLNGNQVMKEATINNELNDAQKNIKILYQFINQKIEESKIPKEKILGVGIGMPGFINVDEGINHSFLKINEPSLIDYLEDKIKLPVFIDNDSSLIGLAELRFGEGTVSDNVLIVNIGWGIGLGTIISNQLFRGENGYAGEFSHIPLYDNNKVCSCGKMGCLETETSLKVIVDRARKGITAGEYTTLSNLSQDSTEAIEQIFSAMADGDTFALSLLNDVGFQLGRGISILIHLFNPSVVVLSGIGAKPNRLWLGPIQQGINRMSIPKLSENTEVKVSALGQDAQLVGAAILVVEKLESLKWMNNFQINEN